ncbi:response regulator [Vibrio sp. ZSDZ65]|uniref:Response regulator n=1 Tax=Vibrio qingdaonensis TaxID=2829491 RepID=A0A9X3CKN4_9VIBR|nr:response regulator [Vibrio qingdaonensis]MCW8345071.1 response regulator [Vibrio qingdaonensis]
MQILICDDSSVARKSLERSIEAPKNSHIIFAEDGYQALDILREGSIDLMFLDLTMPKMDGFEVLALMKHESITTNIVVISGDIQQKAQERCYQLGAYAFIEKPLKQDIAEPLFHDLGLKFRLPEHVKQVFTIKQSVERFRETANIALGKGAAIIAQQLKEFIQLPVPTVGDLSFGEVTMMIEDNLSREDNYTVAQRFVGGGMHGEALICITGSDINQVGLRFGFDQGECTRDELVVNLSNVLVSSFLVSMSEQLGVEFSLREPLRIDHFAPQNSMMSDSEYIFTTEYTYDAETLDLNCSVLFMFDQESVDIIHRQMEILH